MNTDDTYVFLQDEKKRRAQQDKEFAEMQILGKRHKAIERLPSGADFDSDNLSDDFEVQSGLHSEANVPLHVPVDKIKRRGPTTPGSAFVSGRHGMVEFDYDDTMVSLKPHSSHRVVSGVHRMKEPRPMKLSIDYGNKHHHVSKGNFSIDLDVHPELYRMGEGRTKGGIPNLKISSVLENIGKVSSGHHSKMEAFSKKYNADHSFGKKEANRDHQEINDLSKRLAGFVHGQKKAEKKKSSSSGMNFNIGENLDFSAVGIIKKKKGGII